MTTYRGGQSMGVLIGIDPHKSVNAAAIDEQGDFPANRKGLRALERWAKRFPERRWAVDRAAGIGRPVAQRLAMAGEKVVDVPPKLSSKARLLSTGNARKNDRLDATFTAQAALQNERLAPVRSEDGDAHVEVLAAPRRRPQPFSRILTTWKVHSQKFGLPLYGVLRSPYRL
jgi:hypothetical protein